MRSDDEQLNEIESLRERISELETINRGLGLEVTAARSECATLRAELERESKLRAHWHGCFEQKETECEALRTEVDRLRRDALNEAGHAIASEDRLAAANALLGRCSRFNPHVLGENLTAEIFAHLAAQPAPASDPTGLAEAMNQALLGQPQHITQAKLAAQPATAPARDEPPMTPPYAVLADGSIVPLMNCPECNEMGRADRAHYHVCARVVTEAENAVLDDLKLVPRDQLETLRVHGSVFLSNVAVSELARRGLVKK